MKTRVYYGYHGFYLTISKFFQRNIGAGRILVRLVDFETYRPYWAGEKIVGFHPCTTPVVPNDNKYLVAKSKVTELEPTARH